MEVIYSLQGRPFRSENGKIYAKSGTYVGRFKDGMVFAPDGSYLGEMKGDRLAYKTSHATKHRSSHTPSGSRSGISRMNRMSRMSSSGWEEFHG